MALRLALFPLTAEVSQEGHLVIGGCDTLALAKEFGTPLYIFDESTLREKCREFKREFGRQYQNTRVIFAAKAFINRAWLGIVKEEGLGLDVVSAGELSIARSVDFPLQNVYFHGNNKGDWELKLALEWGIGHIVLDNFHELRRLNEIAGEMGIKPEVLLRISPGIDPHTHKYIATGVVDSKFGFPLASAEAAVTQAVAASNLNLTGLHFHIGSLLFEMEPYQESVEAILNFADKMRQKHSFNLKELNIGGGFAIQYLMDTPAPPVSEYARVICSKIVDKCRQLKLTPPQLVIEPGRSIVGRAAVALYTVGAIKDIPGVRCYVSVDGGMSDNIRPALYGSKYEAVIANKMLEKEAGKVTISGKFCESGDILVQDISLPPVQSGDYIAIPDCGAYCVPMSSNYNGFLKPAIVLVKDGKSKLIRRRDTFEDLFRNDVV